MFSRLVQEADKHPDSSILHPSLHFGGLGSLGSWRPEIDGEHDRTSGVEGGQPLSPV